LPAALEPIRNRTKQPRDPSQILPWQEGAAFLRVTPASCDRREGSSQRTRASRGRPRLRVTTRIARPLCQSRWEIRRTARVLDPHDGCRGSGGEPRGTSHPPAASRSPSFGFASVTPLSSLWSRRRVGSNPCSTRVDSPLHQAPKRAPMAGPRHCSGCGATSSGNVILFPVGAHHG
jgi:hypothetical protein